MGRMKQSKHKYRPTLFDSMPVPDDQNAYTTAKHLTNEASVEQFFVAPLLKDLGFTQGDIKPKTSISELTVSKGARKLKYKPDYVLLSGKMPVCVLDAKSPNEKIEDWIEQCSGYCLALNRTVTGANPVQYFLLTNGYRTALYRWDAEQPILDLNFADFNYGNARFDELRSLVGPAGLKAVLAGLAPLPTGQHVFNRVTGEKARQLFAQCHKAIWKSEVCSPSKAFMEFIKLMFVKLAEDKRLRRLEETKAVFADNSAKISVPRQYVRFSSRWIDSRLEDGITNPINDILFHQLRDEIERGIQLKEKKRIFDTNEEIDLRPDTIQEVVRKLEGFDLFGIDEDLNGRLFETFLSATMRGRDLGQFFTPRSIVKMMTKLADLHADRSRQDRILDGCCGTGGFLIEALTEMRNRIRENNSLSENERDNLYGIIANQCLFGVDYGKDPPLARIARINMYLHGDGGSRIYYADTLDKSFSEPSATPHELAQNLTEIRDELEDGSYFDAVLTNPPFSMAKEAKNPAEKKILEPYAVAHDGAKKRLRSSVRSSILFIERYFDLLKPGGYLISVLDDTLLSSSDFRFVRDFIREHFLIRGLISLPGDAFRRSGARVKTSAVILEKKRKAIDKQASCYGYFSTALGVDDLTPRADSLSIARARDAATTEMDKIVAEFRNFMAKGTAPLVLPPSRFADRLDLKFCAPTLNRKSTNWKKAGFEVRPLSKVLKLINLEWTPSDHPDELHRLLKVTYNGDCQVEREILGKQSKASTFYRVKKGQLVFSTIRATDGAVGIVSAELDSAFVSSTSFNVFDVGDEETTAYVWSVLRSFEVRADLQSLSPGTNRYTSYWPDIDIVEIPWPDAATRKKIAKAALKVLEARRAVGTLESAVDDLLKPLDINSEDSKSRFRASKAPT